jgi:hypothetical protein
MNWWKNAYPEEPLEDPFQNTIFVEKFKKIFIENLQQIPKKLNIDKNISPECRFKLPFFYYNGKMFCYLCYHKKYKQPYIGIIDGNKIDHSDLIMEGRK